MYTIYQYSQGFVIGGVTEAKLSAADGALQYNRYNREVEAHDSGFFLDAMLFRFLSQRKWVKLRFRGQRLSSCVLT